MKNVIIAAALIVALGLGYLWYTGNSAQVEVAPAENATVDPQPGDGSGTAIEDPSENAGTSIKEAASEAASVVRNAADDAIDAARKAGEDAADAASGMAEDGARAVDRAAENGVVPDASAEDAANAVSQSARAAAEAADMTVAELRSLLTVEGFDLERATEALNATDLGDEVKATTRSVLESAADNVVLLRGVLSQLRAQLGFAE